MVVAEAKCQFRKSVSSRCHTAGIARGSAAKQKAGEGMCRRAGDEPTVLTTDDGNGSRNRHDMHNTTAEKLPKSILLLVPPELVPTFIDRAFRELVHRAPRLQEARPNSHFDHPRRPPR